VIYFDHNATTPIDERVLEAMLPFFSAIYGNPSSLYRLGRVARSAIDTARQQVAALVNAKPEQVIFTSGGTEANNLALKGCRSHAKLVMSVIEHPSVLNVKRRCKLIAVNAEGHVDLEALEKLKANTFDVASFMLVNNETGVIQDIAQIADIIKAKNMLLHTDAVQAAGKIAVDFKRLNVDLLSLSSHKIYGPKGCGALVIKDNCLRQPQIVGGGQELALRAGTENVAAVVGFGKAAELALAELSSRQQHYQSLKDCLENHLQKIAAVTIFAANSPRVTNTVQFAVKGCVGEMLLMQLDSNGIAVSSGSACASSDEAVSHVLTAMGVSHEDAQSAIRVSLGMQNTLEDVERFVVVLKQIINSRN